MTIKTVIADLLSLGNGKILYDEPMSHHTSLKVGGNADALILIESEDQLVQIVGKLQQAGINYLPVGNLTNIIVRDGGYRGAILLMTGIKEINYQPIPAEGYFIIAQAGAALASVVETSAACELTGCEFCAGIPGSVGGAVWMNAGAFGSEMKDIVSEVTVLDGHGQKRTLMREEIIFGYRKAVLPPSAIIINARLKLAKGNREQIQGKIGEFMQMRKERHPLAYPNAGSIFKNLPGISAGRIIDEMGFKGQQCGDAEVSRKHANFIVNNGHATAADVLNLIHLVTQTAKKEKNVNLETEVVVIGEN